MDLLEKKLAARPFSKYVTDYIGNGSADSVCRFMAAKYTNAGQACFAELGDAPGKRTLSTYFTTAISGDDVQKVYGAAPGPAEQGLTRNTRTPTGVRVRSRHCVHQAGSGAVVVGRPGRLKGGTWANAIARLCAVRERRQAGRGGGWLLYWGIYDRTRSVMRELLAQATARRSPDACQDRQLTPPVALYVLTRAPSPTDQTNTRSCELAARCSPPDVNDTDVTGCRCFDRTSRHVPRAADHILTVQSKLALARINALVPSCVVVVVVAWHDEHQQPDTHERAGGADDARTHASVQTSRPWPCRS